MTIFCSSIRKARTIFSYEGGSFIRLIY